jgi:hypothetical protein
MYLTMGFSEKAYRLLLRAYPRRYRERYAEPMEQLFRDRLCEVRTLPDLAALWMRTMSDWAVSVPARHWERTRPQMHFGTYGHPARRCIYFARCEASSFSHREITLEHLLLGILRQEPSLIYSAGRDAMVRAIEADAPAIRRIPPKDDLRLSWASKRVLAAAIEIARAAGRREIAPRDLLTGILREPDTLAARLLREYIPDPS